MTLPCRRLHNRILLFLAVVSFSMPVFGQQIGCFTFAGDSIGCVPFTVNLVSCLPPGSGVGYNYDYYSDSALAAFEVIADPSGNTSHTYDRPGVYQIRQSSSGLDRVQNAFRRTVRVYAPNSKPVFALTSCPNQVRLTLKDSIFRRCRVEWASQSQDVNVPIGGVQLDLPAPVSVPTPVVVRVTGLDPTNCGNTTKEDTILVYSTLPSARIVSGTGTSGPNGTGIDLTYRQEQDLGYRLQFEGVSTPSSQILREEVPKTASGDVTASFRLPPILKYRIVFTNGIGCASTDTDTLLAINPDSADRGIRFPALDPNRGTLSVLNPDVLISTLPTTATSFTDTIPFRCNEVRCYRLRLVESVHRYDSYVVCVRSGNGQGAALHLSRTQYEDSTRQFRLYFRSGAAVASFEGEGLLAPAFLPTSIALAHPACRPIGFQDSCGNLHPADSTYCPLSLTVTLDHDTRLITATPPSGPGMPIDHVYILETVGADGTPFPRLTLSQPQTRDQSRLPSQRLIYRMKAVSSLYPQDTSVSNPVEIVRHAEIVMAEAFSPNGDGLNDTLTAHVRFIRTADIRIFDSWGTPIFASGLPFVWSGDSTRGKAPAGNYLAVVKATTEDGHTFTQRKWITIVQ